MKRLALLVLIGAAAAAQEVSLRPLATGLSSPVAVTHANDSRLFITEQRGTVVIYDGTSVRATPFLDIRSLVLFSGERGLLSIAFHPQYAANGFFFVDYIDKNGDIVVSRYQVSSDPNVADSGSGTILLTIPHRQFANHNGGQLAFGPDGFLYIGTGDGGSGGDPLGNGQNTNALLGKILRVDVDQGSPYGIPPLNPFAGRNDAKQEIWAYGLRNPWRFSFDRETGDLFIADVGQGSWEEIDFQLRLSPGGENYGWNVMEGTHCFTGQTCNTSGKVLPILEYGHTGGDCSVTGGYRYRGVRSSRLRGTYLYGDFCTGRIWGATQNPNGTWSSSQLFDATFNVSSFGEDSSGEVYVLDYAGRLLLVEDPLAPSIAEVSPSSGGSAGGELVTITGSNLASPASVTFGGAAAAIQSSSATSVTVLTPAAPHAGLVDVALTNAAGTATKTAAFRYDLGMPASIDAHATSATAVSVTWSAVAGADGYEVSRSADGASYTVLGSPADPFWTDDTADPSTAYLYRVRARSASVFGGFTAPDLATTVVFVEDAIVRETHLLQLRTAVNAVRRLSGEGDFSFSDPNPDIVRAVHVTELRTNLDEARTTLGLPVPSHTDPSLVPGVLVKGAHFAELRDGMR